MHPEAVLSDKQKEIRFQKFIQKKRGETSNVAGVSTSNGSSDKVSISSDLVIVPKGKTVL
jgi:hypothetical protein